MWRVVRWRRCVVVGVVMVLAAACGGEPEPEMRPDPAIVEPDAAPSESEGEPEPEARPDPPVVEPDAAPSESEGEPEPEARPEPAIVEPDAAPSESELDAGAAAAGVVRVSESGLDLDRLAAAVATLDPDAICPGVVFPVSLDGVVEVGRISGGCALIEYVELGGRSVAEVREKLASDPTVFAVGVPSVDLVPAVSRVAQVPPFDRDGFGVDDWWHLRDLGAAKLWDPDGWTYEDENQNLRGVEGWPVGVEVVVAVIDDGVDASHRDLDASVSTAGDACHRDPNGSHGTHVAGIVAAEQGNGVDVAGLAPEATILPIKVHFTADFDDGNPADPVCYGRISTLTAAINLARTRGADVINLSLRWHEEGDYEVVRAEEGILSADAMFLVGADTLEWAIEVARLQDIVVVAAAGNCGDWEFNDCLGHNAQHRPASYPGVISVAATDSNRNRAVFSSSNSTVDLAAPGDSILSTVPGGTAHFSGTSMASPMVAAAAAHIIARFPFLTPDEIAQALADTASDAPRRTNDLGYGIINPTAAIEQLDRTHTSDLARPPEPPPPQTPTTYSAVSAGEHHSCGLRTDATITCWGSNEGGRAEAPGGAYSAVSVGDWHSCGLRTDATITCWGVNYDGQAEAPVGAYSAVTAGSWHSCGLRTDATITCWGANHNGQAEAPGGAYSAVTAGGDHSCGLRTDATITCWGSNERGEAEVPGGAYSAVSAGSWHSCGLRTDATITCWGANHNGQAEAPGGAYSAVTAGSWHSCGLRTDATITCWGLNERGQAEAPGGVYSAVTAGQHHSCGLRTDATITCWGSNEWGQAEASAAPAGGSVLLSRGGLGPTSVGEGQGVPCAPDAPTCRYLDVELAGFAPGAYTVSCAHDGWGDFGPSVFWTFSITVDAGGLAVSRGPCFLNFARLTGNGAYVTVTGPDNTTLNSNWLK